MDSKEFGIKMDRLKEMVAEKDYATALRIVEGIDWNRVKSAGLLALASSVYEENGMLEEAKDMLVIAYERSGAGKRILYKLTELAVRSGEVEEAMDYYQEYAAVAPEDPGCLLLQYMILKVQHAPYSQLIKCLELYNEYEPDEKWMYELATTYEAAGRIQDAVALCDRIALMFGSSVYVAKALKLKQKYAKLTDEQRAALYPNSIASAGAHYMTEEPEYTVTKTVREPDVAEERLGDRLAANRVPDEDALFMAYLISHDPQQGQEMPEEKPVVPEEQFAGAQGPIPIDREPEPEEPEEENTEPEPERRRVPLEKGRINEGFLTETEEAPTAAGEPAAAAAAAVAMAAELPLEKDPDAELLKADARIADAKLAREEKTPEPARPQPQARTTFTAAKAEMPVEASAEEEPGESEEMPPQGKTCPGLHLIIEALDEEEGVSIARKELALVYRIRKKNRNVAKASAEKLNKFGDMKALEAKIGDRDLVIVHAGDLSEGLAGQLYRMLEDRVSERSIVLVDTPEGLDLLEEQLPEMFDICDILTDEDAREKDYDADPEAEAKAVPVKAAEAEPEEEEEPERTDEKGGKRDLFGNSKVPFHMPRRDDEIMEFEDFAQYCVYYANDKGCSVSGKALLALYEKIEIMEQDGIALTKAAAEDCVEEAADHAEHPGLKFLFRKKYDKDDLLILREEDFIN